MNILINALKKILASEIYYHGSLDDFKEFNKPGGGHHGKGYYFTPSLSDAIWYAKSNWVINKKYGSPLIIYSVKLNIHSPFDPMSYEDAKRVADYYGLNYTSHRYAGFQYKLLKSEMIEKGLANEQNFNDKIEAAGFDHIDYWKENYKVVFDPKNITIVDKKIGKNISDFS